MKKPAAAPAKATAKPAASNAPNAAPKKKKANRKPKPEKAQTSSKAGKPGPGPQRKKRVSRKFTIDCSRPVEDGIMIANDFVSIGVSKHQILVPVLS